MRATRAQYDDIARNHEGYRKIFVCLCVISFCFISELD